MTTQKGIITTDFGVSDSALSVTLQADGKLMVAGTSNGIFALARYNANGSLDTTFDGDGKLSTAAIKGTYVSSVALQSDGKWVTTGEIFISGSGTSADFGLARYNSDGSLDTTFDGDGKVATAFGTGVSYDSAYSSIIQPDGKLVAAGSKANETMKVFKKQPPLKTKHH